MEQSMYMYEWAHDQLGRKIEKTTNVDVQDSYNNCHYFGKSNLGTWNREKEIESAKDEWISTSNLEPMYQMIIKLPKTNNGK